MNFRNISSWCIRNPVAPIVLFIGLMLAGIVSFMGMTVTQNPDIEFPVVVVREGREYWAYVPDLPGVYGRGRTAAGAKKDITDALTLYIEDCLA